VAGGCLAAVPMPAAPALHRYVLGYSGFLATPAGALSRRILPVNITTLIVDWTGTPALVTGPRDTGLLYQEPGWRNGVAIGLTPAGVRAFLGVRQRDLVGQIVSLDELIRPARHLAERLAELPDWSSRAAALDGWFAARLSEYRAPEWEPVIDAAWSRLQTAHAPATIGALAAELGVSQRYLQLGFRRQFGLAPKTVARIARFQDAAVTLTEGTAAVRGYADQSHFIRETRAMVGVTPRELFAFVQDVWAARA
jgi:AraC-like DNA-binding protein